MRYSSAHRTGRGHSHSPSFLPQSFAVPAPLLPGAPSRAQKPPGRGLLFPVIHGSVLHEPVVPAIRFRVIRHRSTIPEFISGTFLVIPVLCTIPFLSPNTLFSWNYIALPWAPPPVPHDASMSPKCLLFSRCRRPPHTSCSRPRRFSQMASALGPVVPLWRPRARLATALRPPSRSFAFPLLRLPAIPRPSHDPGFPPQFPRWGTSPFLSYHPEFFHNPVSPVVTARSSHTAVSSAQQSVSLKLFSVFCFLSQFRIFVLSEIQVSYHIPSPKFLPFPPSFLFAP